LGTYLDHLTVERGLSTNTLLSYRRDLRRYLGFLAARGTVHPGEVTEPDVDAFLLHLRTGDSDHPALGAASAGRAVVTVRGFHRFCLREGLAPSDPRHRSGPRPPAGGCPRRSRSTR